MTLEEYEHLEKDFLTSSTDIRTFLEAKGLSPHKYYYWKRRSRELKDVNGNEECSDFGNQGCSVFGNISAVDSATMLQSL